jgi:hypothetical protein
LLAAGCAFDAAGEGGDGQEPGDSADSEFLPATVDVSGQVLGFSPQAEIEGQAEIVELGLSFPIDIQVTGSSFTIRRVPRQSVLLIEVSAPGHRPTMNAPIVAANQDLEDVKVFAVSEAYIDEIASTFALQDSSTLVLALVQNADGQPFADIEKGVFELATPTPGEGPFLLGSDLRPRADLVSTTSSGYVVFSGATGDLAIKAREGRGYQVEGPGASLDTGEVALLRLLASPGELALPTDVALENDIVPIFEARGCTECHTKNGEGKQLGGLSLEGDANHVRQELMLEVSPRTGIVRVNTAAPRNSLLLTRPNAEFPPDVHPYTTFNGVLDEDYLKILSWIQAGASKL